MQNFSTDFDGTVSRRTGHDTTPSGLAEVWRAEAGTWRFLHMSWKLGSVQPGRPNISVIENSSIIHRSPATSYTSALR